MAPWIDFCQLLGNEGGGGTPALPEWLLDEIDDPLLDEADGTLLEETA